MYGNMLYGMQDRALREQDLARTDVLPARQGGAPALRPGGSRRAGGDLAFGLGEAGGEGPVVKPAPSRGKWNTEGDFCEGSGVKARREEFQEGAGRGGARPRLGLARGRAGRGGWNPRAEREREEHAGARGLDTRRARRRLGRGLRRRRREVPEEGAAEHEPGERRGQLLQEDVSDGEPALRS